MLLNLISNAVKFTDKGSVTLVAELVTSEVHSDSENGPEASTSMKFSVIDTGRGISRRKTDEIFKPFVQARHTDSRNRLGTGLGLTISQRLADLLGGELRVTSKLKKGSTFTLTINPGDISGQSCRELDLSIDPSQTKAWQLDNFTGRILVADDIEDIRELVQSILDETGIAYDSVTNGQEALDTVMNNPETYALLIMDINMPLLRGDEVIRRLHESGRQIPSIALTAEGLRGDRERYLEAGFDGYVSKPISANRLLAEIERIHDREHGQSADASVVSTLIIEDNIDARNAMCDMLSLLDIQAAGAASLDEASALLDNNPVKLVLTDLHLENENGLDIARTLKSEREELRIVLVSGDTELLDKNNVSPPEIDKVLIKPVTADDIRKLIDELMVF